MKIKFQRIANKQEGQGLLEAIVALTVAVLVIVGLIRVIVTSMSTNDFSKKNITATHLAQQTMEKIRSYRDNFDWVTFNASCLNNPKSTMNLNLDPTYDGIYELTVVCSDPGPAPLPTNKRKVVVTVSWTDSSGTQHPSTQESYFTKILEWK